MTQAEFFEMESLDRLRLIQTTRAGRSNLQCLLDIFGEVPEDATAFHTDQALAIFLDGRKPDWYVPVAQVPLTTELIHQLRLVGMLGSFGWELRRGGSFSDILQATLDVVENKTEIRDDE